MSDHDDEATSTQGLIEDEAVGWFIRMRGDTHQDLKARFDAWYAASAEHRRAYHWAEGHFAASAVLKSSSKQDTGWPRRRSTWLAAAAAAAAVVLLAFASQASRMNVIARGGGGSDEAVTPLITAAREIRTWHMSDGSSVTLDAGSRVDVAISAAARRVRIRHGRARFSVVHDPRPFVVEAAAGAVAIDEAVVDVGFERSGRVMVDLLSGSAEVHNRMRSAVFMVSRHALRPGRAILYPGSAFAPAEVEGYGTPTREWPRGWVEYRSIRLRDLVAQANRYAGSPIVIRDPAVGEMSASGRFKLTDTDAFVSRIAEALDLAAKRRSDGIYLERR